MSACPTCLAESNQQGRLVYDAHHECAHFSRNPELQPILCSRKLFECGGDGGTLLYLPPFSSAELSKLYKVYTGQRTLRLTHPRPIAQAALIKEHVLDHWHHRWPVHVVEIGCAGAFMLAILARSMRSGRLTCFEADQKMASASATMLDNIAQQSGGNISTRLIRSFFDPSLLIGEHDLADVFASSHVVEHIPDPCPWLSGVHRLLRPGGHVMTEIPDQHQFALVDQKKLIVGQFHATYFDAGSFDRMMTRMGFETLFNSTFYHSPGWAARFMHKRVHLALDDRSVNGTQLREARTRLSVQEHEQPLMRSGTSPSQ